MNVFDVSLLVSLQLGAPVVHPGFRNVRVDATTVLVPETPPHFDDFLEPWEHQIRFARQFRGMKPIPITHAVSKLTHYHLRFHALAPDSAHVFAAPIHGDCIHT